MAFSISIVKLGFIILMAAGLLFAGIAENVMSGGVLTLVDAQVAQWLHAHSTSVLTQCLLMLTHLHDPIVISVVVVLIVLYLIWKKQWYTGLAVMLVVQGGMLLNLLVKRLFQRARPSFENPLVELTTYSFPSGHVAASTIFYGVMAVLLIAHTSSNRQATLTMLIAFTMVVLVAFSRMYLGAHYLSDVLAAFFEGIAWLVLCWLAMHTYRINREKNN